MPKPLAPRGAAKALLQPRPILRHRARHEAERQPAVGNLGGELHRRLVAGAEVDRDVGAHVQDRFQWLADAHGARAGIGQADLATLMCDRRLAGKHLAHDGDVVLDPPIGFAPGLAVPAFHDLRAGDADPRYETTAAGERVDGRRRHRGVGRGARGKLHDGGAELDVLGLAGEECQRRHRIRAVGLRGPHQVVAQRLGALHQLDGNVEDGAGIADAQAEFHRSLLVPRAGVRSPPAARPDGRSARRPDRRRGSSPARPRVG